MYNYNNIQSKRTSWSASHNRNFRVLMIQRHAHTFIRNYFHFDHKKESSLLVPLLLITSCKWIFWIYSTPKILKRGFTATFESLVEITVLAKIRIGHLPFHLLHFTLFTFRCHCIMVASYLLKIANCGPKNAKFSTKMCHDIGGHR